MLIFARRIFRFPIGKSFSKTGKRILFYINMITDICCIGHITKDKIVTPRFTKYMSGGTSFYFCSALSCLPRRVPFRMVTKLAAADMKAADEMRAKGVDVKVWPSKETLFFENKYGENQDDRTQRVLAKSDPFTVAELADEEAKVYHLGSLLANDFSPEVVKMLSDKGRVSIEAQGFLREVRGENVYAVDWNDKLKMLRMTDTIKLNEHEMEVITGSKDAREAAGQLARWGVREVIITLGSCGSLIFSDGQSYEIPAFAPKEIVDATGCGDTYSAGYFYQRLQGADCESAGRYAAAMCTLKLQHSGPFNGTDEDIKRILES